MFCDVRFFVYSSIDSYISILHIYIYTHIFARIYVSISCVSLLSFYDMFIHVLHTKASKPEIDSTGTSQ